VKFTLDAGDSYSIIRDNVAVGSASDTVFSRAASPRDTGSAGSPVQSSVAVARLLRKVVNQNQGAYGPEPL